LKVISNTSPIIFLNKLDALDLLPALFEEVITSEGVVAELDRVDLPSFVQVEPLSKESQVYVNNTLGRLHRGELETLALTREKQADFVLVDDLLARREAERLNLRAIGTIGILLLARKRQVLTPPEALNHLSSLVENHGLYISAKLFANVRAELSE